MCGCLLNAGKRITVIYSYPYSFDSVDHIRVVGWVLDFSLRQFRLNVVMRASLVMRVGCSPWPKLPRLPAMAGIRRPHILRAFQHAESVGLINCHGGYVRAVHEVTGCSVAAKYGASTSSYT